MMSIFLQKSSHCCELFTYQAQKCSESVQKVEKVTLILLGIVASPILEPVVNGLADFLGLETLRHGTSLKNYISIQLNGADPSYSLKQDGSTRAARLLTDNTRIQQTDWESIEEKCKNYFFVFPDNVRFSYYNSLVKTSFGEKLYFCLTAKMHLFFTASGQWLPENASIINKIFAISVGLIQVATVPTCLFYFRQEEIEKEFIPDPDYNYLALKTRMKIGTDHMGIQGVYKAAVEGNIVDRIKEHPYKAMWGLARIINPIGITLLAGFGIYCIYKRTTSDGIRSLSFS